LIGLLFFFGQARKVWPFIRKWRTRILLILCVAGTTAYHSSEGWQNPVAGIHSEWSGAMTAISNRQPDKEITATSQSRSVSDRLSAVKVGLNMFREAPLMGSGLGGFEKNFPRANREAGYLTQIKPTLRQGHAHNDWLQIAIELGLVGYLPLVLVLILLKKHLRPGVTPTHWSAYPSGLALVGISVFATFNFPFYNAVPPFLTTVALAIFTLSILPPDEVPPTELPCSIKPCWRWILRSVMILVVIFFICHRAAVWHYEYRLVRITENYTQHNWSAVIEHSEKLPYVFPGRHSHVPYLAQAYIATGAFDRAEAALRSLLRAEPYHGTALAQISIVFAQSGRFKAARHAITEAVSFYPNEGSWIRLRDKIIRAGSDAGQEANQLQKTASQNSEE